MKPLGPGDPLRLGPYRVLGVLGEGGMGKVYFGTDAARQPAAVKVLLPELAQDEHLAHRFVREAQTARAVTSPGVARVLGADLEAGRPWIATEFLAGPTLDEAVERFGPLGDTAWRELAGSLARTLGDVHAAGLVHRDVKPSNVVLTSHGPRLIDFGIARPEHGLTLTRTGQIPVTPGYGAPEQVLGRRVGPAADVFSLGAVLVLASGGRPPYTGAEVTAVLYAVVHGDPDLSAVPEALRYLVWPCLAKDPAQRPTPAQVAGAVAAPHGAGKVWRSGPLGEEIRRRETAARRQADDEARAGTRTLTATGAPPAAGLSRRRLLSLAGGGALLLAAGGGGTAWWLGHGEDTPSDPFDVPPAVHVAAAKPGSSAGTPEPLWGPHPDVADPGSGPPLPVGDVVVFAASGGGVAARRVTDGRAAWQVDAAADAGYLSIGDRLVATADADGTLRTFVASTGSPRWTADADAKRLLAADARHVHLLTSEGALRCVSTATGRVQWTRKPPLPLTGGAPAAALGAGHLVLCTDGGDVMAVRAQDGVRAWVRKGQAAGALAPAIDGGIAYLGGHTLAAVDIAGKKEKWSRDTMLPVRDGRYGWGPPTVAGGVAYAVDGDALKALKPDGSQAADPVIVAGVAPPWRPPVVQGGSVWLVESGDTGVSGYPRTGPGNAATATQTFPLTGGQARYAAGDRNRLFVLNQGTLLALPVF
ncbi:protein kinase [Streptomyces sp. NPDC059740]|uniref:protein kinase domain-containing protein n=1 Tax=Streptomyces sp. NPDC059740 TaxID=3346926 RepID=UPI0036588032